MMKSKKNVADLNWKTSSVMRWGSGEEVIAYLDWDERRYYLWFEPTDNFTDWCEEVLRGYGDDRMMQMLDALTEELARIGVQEFCDLESVNKFCKKYCGSDDLYDCAEFYEDDWGNICGA
jgi:hypothetical protein